MAEFKLQIPVADNELYPGRVAARVMRLAAPYVEHPIPLSRDGQITDQLTGAVLATWTLTGKPE